MEGIIGQVNDKSIYAIKGAQYQLIRERNDYRTDYYYLILDKGRFLIQGDYIVGQMVGNVDTIRWTKTNMYWKDFFSISVNRGVREGRLAQMEKLHPSQIRRLI